LTTRPPVIVNLSRARIRVTDSCRVRDKIARSDLWPNWWHHPCVCGLSGGALGVMEWRWLWQRQECR